MSNKMIQLNAIRRDTANREQNRPKSRAVPGEITSGWHRTRAGSNKPSINLFNGESRKRGKMWEENFTAATERGYQHEREMDDYQVSAEAATEKNAIDCEALRVDAAVQSKVAQSLAQEKQLACAKGMHNGKNLVVFGSNLIRFVEGLEESDEETVNYYKGMVRRLARGAMMDWESAALGSDFDPSTFGGLE